MRMRSMQTAVLVLAGMGAVPALAQSTVTYRVVTHTTVLPGRGGDYQAAMKEYNDVLRKAGWDKRMSAWRSASGPGEYRAVTMHNTLADLDAPMSQDPKLKDVRADLARINARIGACVERSTRVIEVVDSDLSLPRTPQPPKMLRVLHSYVRPDKVEEYRATLKSDWLPALKESGARSFTVSRVSYGGSRYEFYSTTGMESWGELDGMSPARKAMGEERYARYMGKMNTLVTRVEANVYRYVADLSYVPAAGTGAGGQ